MSTWMRAAGTDEDAIAAELALQGASALRALGLDTVYEAWFDILPPRYEPPNRPQHMRELEVRCRLMQYACQTTPVFPVLSFSAARATMMHVFNVAQNPHYEPEFRQAYNVARYLVARRYRAGSDNGLSQQQPLQGGVAWELHDDAWQYVVGISPGPFSESSISLRRSPLSEEARADPPPPAGGHTGNSEISLAEARLALPDLEREVNESLSELALPNLRAQVEVETGPELSSYLDITWMILGTIGSGMAGNACYDVAKIVLLRQLRKLRGSGESEAAPALRDEAVALARWCVALEYDRAATDFVEAGESRDNSAWVIDLKDDGSRYRVTIPHGETRRSHFNLERRPLE